jgi:hypothetical protein
LRGLFIRCRKTPVGLRQFCHANLPRIKWKDRLIIAKLAIETIYPRASPLISLRDMGSKESGVRRQKKIKENEILLLAGIPG